MKCLNCGFENSEDAKFCEKCGASLNNESFSKTNNVLIICIIAVLCVAVVAGIFVYMNMNSGPTLSDFGVSEFVEGDDYSVLLLDENGTPMEGQPVVFTCHSTFGDTIMMYNTTDYYGKCSFDLCFNKGNYKIDANYVDGDFDGGFYNITGFTKTITIKEGPYPQYNEEFIDKYIDYVVWNKTIMVNSDSFKAETISGQDIYGNNYSWFGGAWFRQEDISNGNVDILD